ncbi:squalene--hopene cyclase [Paenibacillus sp. GCM10023248]|uniref:squalene--hopene cyclase n=1 Tax=unclassified Paenibacillus TaxID=185978 RepID=UPI002377E3AD|nr:squalene--hopene cyclase [Paenibacillus sp. MAHUQ-63]MDD9268223.1 squalene--hopene cyclase [Paenibacillus sp. MAHUQ-63]
MYESNLKRPLRSYHVKIHLFCTEAAGGVRMPVWHELDQEIRRLTGMLERLQEQDGTWRFCFENSLLTDAYLIIVLRTLELPQEALIQQLHDRIAAEQRENGAWSVYRDEAEGNLDATVNAYFAMLYSGYSHRSDEAMIKAERFIKSNGGLNNVRTVLTKVFLAAAGQYAWPSTLMIPLEFLLLPPSSPISFYDFSGFARVHFAPILIMADRQFVRTTAATPDLAHLYTNPKSSKPQELRPATRDRQLTRGFQELLAGLQTGIKQLAGLPEQLHKRAVQAAESYMLERIEADGTLYSYATSTLLMILALSSLGYDRHHPVIDAAVRGLFTMLWEFDGKMHLQNSPSTIWDTALLAAALQQADPDHPAVSKAIHYLLGMQHDKFGDWSLHVMNPVPGGWGFSESNTINPDVDDTTAALRSIRAAALKDPVYLDAWNRGLNWVLAMQNKDGGWPAFERGVTNRLLTLFPIDGASAAAIDPSTADLTGRTLEFLGATAGLDMRTASVRRGAEWLFANQEENGSWYGRWGICYIYGTWAALTGLMAVRADPHHPALRKAADWLLHIQNEDGGWGESCMSDSVKMYLPLGSSTPSQTAWALDALIAVSPEPLPAIDKGIRSLLRQMHANDWTTRYPTGAGLPGSFYSNYHSYRYIWPFFALNHYVRKYGTVK